MFDGGGTGNGEGLEAGETVIGDGGRLIATISMSLSLSTVAFWLEEPAGNSLNRSMERGCGNDDEAGGGCRTPEGMTGLGIGGGGEGNKANRSMDRTLETLEGGGVFELEADMMQTDL